MSGSVKALVTMPGRHGDILWSLPTARAIAEAYDTPVDVIISGKYGSLQALIEAQPYVDTCAVDASWAVQETAPMSPRTPPVWPTGYDRVFHLGYAGWPEEALPYECCRIANITRATNRESLLTIDLARPWIGSVAPSDPDRGAIGVGWSDEWFELKYGLTQLIQRAVYTTSSGGFLLCAPGSRWEREASYKPTSWPENFRSLTMASTFVGCCSALHVLACAVGVPRVLILEPNSQRHHPVFYPYGQNGPRTVLIRGGDGQPTFDARHLVDAITQAQAVVQ